MYCTDKLPEQEHKIELLTKSNQLQESEIVQLKTKVDLLIQDKTALSKSTEAYKDLYTKKANKVDELEKSAPSRATWFAIGAASALAVLLGGFVILK